MKKFIFFGLVILAVMAVPVSPARADVVWFQGFETDYDGWIGTVNRTDAPSPGPASGSWYAIFEDGPYTLFDGYRDTWPGEWSAYISVYLDPAWPAGTGFDYSVAATGSDGAHQRDFIFHVTKDTSTGDLMVAGSNNTNFAPREDLENINHRVIGTAGWYVFHHRFRDEGGVLAVDLILEDTGGNVLFTETRTNPADTIPDEVGGNRYSWFTFINVPDGISVDNHSLELPPPPTVKIDGCDTGVVDFEYQGKLFSLWIEECAAGAANHGDFVSCVTQLASDAKKAGLISGRDQGAITSCAAKSDIPSEADGDLPPEIGKIKDQKLDEGSPFSLDIASYTTEPDGDAITWELTGTLPAGVAFDGTSGLLEGTPEAGTSGDYPLSVKAEDKDGESNTVDFALKVSSKGKPPKEK